MFLLVVSILCQLGANQKKKLNKKNFSVKFFGKFSLVGQLGLVHCRFMDNLLCNWISHNPFVTCVSNLQRKYPVKDSENYKCKTGKV